MTERVRLPGRTVAVAFIAGSVGACIGFLVRELPRVVVKPEVTIAEGANFFLNIALVIIVPTVVARAVEARKRRGDRVAEIVHHTIGGLRAIQHAWDEADAAHPLALDDTRLILRRFKQADVDISLAQQVAAKWFGGRHEANFEVCGALVTQYWRIVTDRLPTDGAVPPVERRAETLSAYNDLIRTLTLLAEDVRAS